MTDTASRKVAGLWRAHRITVQRYATLPLVAAVVYVIPKTPLEGPVGGLLAILAILVCAWFAGPVPALLYPIVIFAISRSQRAEPPAWNEYTLKEVITFGVMSVLTAAVGLAGQYRRRVARVSENLISRMQDQARALGMAPIVFCDADGRVTTWNEGAERLYGWTSADADGRVLHELLESRFPQPRDEIEAALRDRRQWRGEVVQRHRDGRELNVAVHAILYGSENGAERAIAEVHHDVTPLRRAEEQIRESDHRKDQFIATLAHELRNPLAPIRSGLEALRTFGAAEGSPQDELHDMMERQIENMVRLVNDLLDVSRINTGKMELRRGPIALADVVRDAVECLRSRIDESGVQFESMLPSSPIVLDADRVRLTQVLANLLDNAVKFTPPGGRIALTGSVAGESLEIRVRDTGTGIAKERLSELFQMFSTEEDLLNRSQGGLGIGLSICRALVEMHGGTIEARSEGAGRGAEFAIRLPRPATSPQSVESSPVVAKPVSAAAMARRVLVVDDNQDAARSLVRLLSKLGCDCRGAFDGPTALEIANDFRPDAFLLDLGMPGMNGLELAQRIRSTPALRDSLLIALTGWNKEIDRMRSQEAGFDHHLVKPAQASEVCALLSVRRK